jgi:hypothetical protein
MRLIWTYQPVQEVDMKISTSLSGWYVHINLLNRLIFQAPLSPEIFKFRPLLSNSRPEGVFAWNQPAENNRNWGNDDINLFIYSSDHILCTVYNMSGRVVSDIQTRAEGESLYIIGYTNSSRRREFVYPIQHGRECCKRLKKRLILWVHWRSNFKNKRCLSRENQSLSLCKSTWICFTYTDTTRLWFFFVFSAWIINEFFNVFWRFSSLKIQAISIQWEVVAVVGRNN